MKRTKIWFVVLAAVLGLSGCAGSAPPPAAAPNAWGGSDNAASAEASWGGPASAPASASAPMSDEAAATGGEYEAAPSEAAPRSRPGLGTVWGENRSSYVSTAAFYRADPNNPFATLAIYYNDAQGVRAMADHSARSNWGDNLYPAADQQLSVRVLGENYSALPGTQAGGRTYVVGESGQRYILRVQNHTGNRVEVVASVDGLDVIDGQPGAFGKRGYILQPWGTLDIEGFRRSDSTVAAFRFGSVEESYADRKGQGRNVGVIGVAFFHESGSRWPWTDEEVRHRHDADPFPGRYAEPPR